MSIQHGLDMSSYLAMDALSSTVAFEVVNRSPFHAKYKKTSGALWAKTADIGTVAHKMILENSEEGIVLVDAADFRTKAAQQARDEAYSEGKTPILAHQLDEIRRMVNAARASIADSELAVEFGKGDAEVSIDWEDHGITCKARPDYLTERFHISLKTTAASAEPSVWSRRQLGPSGYDFQLAFYDRGLRKNGIQVKHRLLVVEQNPPYGCCVIELGSDKRTIAEARVDQAIKTWAKCLASAKFPGYLPHVAEATPWEIAEAEEKGLQALGVYA
jgi:hypothetical protein